jgi:hypothetical protein
LKRLIIDVRVCAGGGVRRIAAGARGARIEYNKPMSQFSRCLAFLVISQAILVVAQAQTTTIIPANEAAAHVSEYATVEGIGCESIHIQELQHVSKYRRQLSKSGVYRLDPAGIASKQIANAVRYRREERQNLWPNRDVQRQTGNPAKCSGTAQDRVILPKASPLVRDVVRSPMEIPKKELFEPKRLPKIPKIS